MERRALGRGLDALIGTTRAPVSNDGTANEVSGANQAAGPLMAAIERITPSPFQPRQRFDPERLEELTRAIQAHGVIEPLIVRPAANSDSGQPGYELIAGERRLRAARAAGLYQVPVVVRDLDDHAALEMSLVENIAREELNPLEEGLAFLRLSREFGLSHEEIAGRIGKSRPYVSNAVRLLDLPEPVIDMVANGELSAGQARPLLGITSVQAQIAAARQIAEGKISARGAEQIAGNHRRRRSGNTDSDPATDDPNLVAMAEGLQRALKRKVRIIHPAGKRPGRIEIDYYNDDDLTALAGMLNGTGRSGLGGM